MSKVKCCICGNDLENEWGNNPAPVITTEGAKCCSDCNMLFVVPARMGQDFTFEGQMKAKGVAIYTIDKLKELYVNGDLKSGLYTSKDEDGCDVIVAVQQGVGFDIHTNQKNGWVRVDSFDYDANDKTFTQGESFGGKWK